MIPKKCLDARSVRATITNDYVSLWCDQTGWSLQLHLDHGGRNLLDQLGLPAPPRDNGPDISEPKEVNVRIAGTDTEEV